jgi:hypothetical protein
MLSLHDAEPVELRARALREDAARRFYQWRWRLARARAAERAATAEQERPSIADLAGDGREEEPRMDADLSE